MCEWSKSIIIALYLKLHPYIILSHMKISTISLSQRFCMVLLKSSLYQRLCNLPCQIFREQPSFAPKSFAIYRRCIDDARILTNKQIPSIQNIFLTTNTRPYYKWTIKLKLDFWSFLYNCIIFIIIIHDFTFIYSILFFKLLFSF